MHSANNIVQGPQFAHAEPWYAHHPRVLPASNAWYILAIALLNSVRMQILHLTLTYDRFDFKVVTRRSAYLVVNKWIFVKAPEVLASFPAIL